MTLLFMFFLHIVDDFYLQPGMLSKLKCMDFWEKNAPDELYKYDFVAALIIHSFSWSFMIMLPIFFNEGFVASSQLIAILGCNLGIHLLVDNAKANLKSINLCVDQSIHIAQIIVTFLFWRYVYCG